MLSITRLAQKQHLIHKFGKFLTKVWAKNCSMLKFFVLFFRSCAIKISTPILLSIIPVGVGYFLKSIFLVQNHSHMLNGGLIGTRTRQIRPILKFTPSKHINEKVSQNYLNLTQHLSLLRQIIFGLPLSGKEINFHLQYKIE